MAILPVAFDVPDFIQAELESGSLIRYGGIIRDQAGHIVQHLSEVDLPGNDSAGKAGQLMSFAKKNKGVLIGTAIVVAAAAAAGIGWVISRNKKNQTIRIPKCIVDFNSAFQCYITSIQAGTLDQKILDDVLKALEEIKKNQESGGMDITFSVENAQYLVDMVRDYTERLADANSYKMPEHITSNGNTVIDLQQYLSIQKDICKACA